MNKSAKYKRCKWKKEIEMKHLLILLTLTCLASDDQIIWFQPGFRIIWRDGKEVKQEERINPDTWEKEWRDL